MIKKLVLSLLAAGSALSLFAAPAEQPDAEKPSKQERKERIKEHLEMHFKPYGFIRSYIFVDTRATKSLTEDMFFFLPLDSKEVGGQDINAVTSWNFQAISTRLGLDIKDYVVGSTSIEGKIEGDFYFLAKEGAAATFRMRQAYVKLGWAELGRNGKTSLNLLVGQTWHPMAADMAHGINLETGAPFSPFNRSAQVQFNANLGEHVTLTAAAISHMQYKSNGPQGVTNKYMRHSLPEFYAGISVKGGGFLGRAGLSIMNLKPQYGYYNNTEDATDPLNGKKYNEWMTSFSPFIYLQYTKGIFQIKAKSVFAQSGEYMQLNNGYAATGLKDDGISYEYTPVNASVNFLSFMVGKKAQGMLMVGYHKNLGTFKDVLADKVYFSGNGFANIDQILRITPGFIYNLGKLQFALEYNYTMVRYGTITGNRVLPTENLHWIGNHRILTMVKFNF